MKKVFVCAAAALTFASLTLLAIPILSSRSVTTVGGGVVSILNCNFSHTLADDPIVHPGEPGAAHMHNFVGSNTTNADSTYASMTASTTSCPLTRDTAGYWAPELRSPDGVPVAVRSFNIYYRSVPGAVVQAFPPDLRIIAGGDTQNTFDTGQDPALSWSCSDRGPFFTSPPDCTATGRNLTLGHIHFPNCLLDGATDSPDHRSHMVFSVGVKCPSGYVMVPKILINVIYKVGNALGYTLSSDAGAGFSEGGRSLHADFWMTWDQATFQVLVDMCLNLGRSCSRLTDANFTTIVGVPLP